MRRTFLLLGLLLPIVPLPAPAQGLHLQLVADSGVSVPGGQAGETFSDLGIGPILVGPRCAAFLGEGNAGTRGIFLVDPTRFELLVQTGTPIPGGQPGETFASFGAHSIDGCDVVFQGCGDGACGSSGTIGIYRKRDGEPLEVIADTSTPAPVGTFTDLDQPWAHRGRVTFLASHAGCPNAIYFFDGGSPDLVVDDCGFPLPDGEPGEVFVSVASSPILGDEHISFRGVGDQGTVGIYLASSDGIRAAADTGTPYPGGTPGETFAGFLVPWPLSGNAVAFLGLGSSGLEAGIFRESDGVLEEILNLVTTTYPGWDPGEDIFFGVLPFFWYANGRLTLGATGTLDGSTANSRSVFLLDEEGLHSVVEVGDFIDGSEVTEVLPLAHTDPQGRRIGLNIDVDGQRAFYLARRILFEDGFETGDFSGWDGAVP